jgi:oxygen-independent coproporphyrinogen III oxidase
MLGKFWLPLGVTTNCMAGLYIHIPFCRKVCFYCDFHFTVSLKNKDKIVESICREALLRSDYLEGRPLKTIYLGGGTPSVLGLEELLQLFSHMYKILGCSNDMEITLEANPDDLTLDYLQNLKKYTPINRLSVGIQSFIDKHLIWMNRRHTAEEAIKCIEHAHQAGFENINTDLIYGIPQMNLDQWHFNLETMTQLNVQHISAYHLTIEPNTILGRRYKKGLVQETGEQLSWQQFEMLVENLGKKGYDHYEISNFAQPGFYSQHNTNYWNYIPYLGLGPSAHSFNGHSRQWNSCVNADYIAGVETGGAYFETEKLGANELYNEYVMLAMRTKWGVDKENLKEQFGNKYLRHFVSESVKFVETGHMVENTGQFRLTCKGKFISDYVISGLFYME